jgi:hypothetical protein
MAGRRRSNVAEAAATTNRARQKLSGAEKVGGGLADKTAIHASR